MKLCRRHPELIALAADDSDLVCQAGATWESINEHLQELNLPLFFPVSQCWKSVTCAAPMPDYSHFQLDPGPSATIGGMMSTGCSGTNAVRYGTARGEWFLNAVCRCM